MISQEQEVCSLETSEKLVELGVKIESNWWWVKSFYPDEFKLCQKEVSGFYRLQGFDIVEKYSPNNCHSIPAPTFTELWKRIPDSFCKDNKRYFIALSKATFNGKEITEACLESLEHDTWEIKENENLAEALGQMVCWLAEQKLLNK